MADIYKRAYLRDKFIDFSEANLSIASSPILYGLSTYTVIPVFWNKQSAKLNVFKLQAHFNRLQNSAKILSFNDYLKKWDEDEFSKLINKLLKDNKVEEDCLVRATIFVDGILTGTRMNDIPHELSVFIYKRTPLMPEDGAHLGVSSWRRTPDNAIPARAKVCGSYVNSALMKNEALSLGYDDAIALDEQGHVTESTVSNIFLVRDNKLITPAASSDLLEGITRDTVFKLAEQLNLEFIERAVDRSELYIADEVFLCGSSMSIAPVTMIDHRPIGTQKVGLITKKLIKAYDQLVRSN
jgi:branched-chain amino acid aminotransferase